MNCAKLSVVQCQQKPSGSRDRKAEKDVQNITSAQ